MSLMSRIVLTLIGLTLVAFILLNGCHLLGDSRVWSTEDKWHNPPPKDLDAWRWCEKRSVTSFWALEPSLEKKAFDLLATQNILKLEAPLLKEFGHADLSIPDGHRAYLVRAVALDTTNGGYTVGLSDDGSAALIIHHSMGRHARPMIKSALIVVLPEPHPEKIYITCTASA